MTRAEEPLIRVEGLHHTYQAGTRKPIAALRGIDLTVRSGDYIALIGANGSGKSTLLRHLNALLLPTVGDVWIAGRNTRDPAHLRDIRSTVGMVFQSPDSQIVATTVEEDVAFGPENLGIPEQELRERVDWALSVVGLSPLRARASHLLSAGQKQRLAIAAALAMHPRCLLLDEATAMLDPLGRQQFLDTVRSLHRDGMTVVAATHNMDEAAAAEQIVVLSQGQIALQGSPRTVFAQESHLHELKLDVPAAARVARTIAQAVPGFPVDALNLTDLLEAVSVRLPSARGAAT